MSMVKRKCAVVHLFSSFTFSFRFTLFVVPTPRKKFGLEISMTNIALAHDWVHMVTVIHGVTDGKGFSVYFNATRQATDTNLANTAATGKNLSSMEFGPNVAVDEFVIWLRELTPEQVQMLYNFYMEFL